MTAGLVGRDVYLRLGVDAPIQRFRVWDAELFIAAREDDARKSKPPIEVVLSTEASYVRQLARDRRK